MSLRTSILSLLLAATCALATAGRISAQDLQRDLRRDLPVEITADRIVYEVERQVYVAEGSVRVVQAERRIDADWLVFNRITRRGIAAGHVRATDGASVLEARFIEFDEVAQQGLVLSGRLDLGEDDFRLAAGELVKTGEDSYEGADVSMTTCRCPDDDDRLPWVINADEADVEIGGYAMVTNSTVDILGVPTVWLPWAMFPVKTERATGLLAPELGYGGGNGFEFALPFFWAARDNINVTLTSRYMSERGFKPELLVETVYGEKSSTELFASYLRDSNPAQIRGFTKEAPSVERKKNQYDPDRWAVGFDNDVYAPGGLRLRSDIQVLSDNDYVRDFEEFRELRKDRFVESMAFGFRHFTDDGSAAVVASALYRDDRQNPDRVDRDEYVLQRAGALELAWLPTRVDALAALEFGMGVDYTNFWAYKRADSVLDLTPTSGGVVGKDRFVDIGIGSIPDAFPPTDPDNREKFGIDDGRFQEGEPLNDKGHRVILNPHLGYSFRLFDALDLRPEVGWHETLYTTASQNFADRGFVTGRVDASSQLLGGLELPGLPPLKHILEPRVSWAYVSKTSQSSNPFFVPETKVPQSRLRQLSLDNVVLDSADRIPTANILSAGLGNRFYTGAGSRRRLLAELDLSAAYDFAGPGEFGLAIAEGQLLPWRRMRAKFNVAYDLDKTRIEQGLFDVAVSLRDVLGLLQSSRLSFGYRYRQAVGLFFESFEDITRVEDLGGGFRRFKNEFTRINQLTAGTRLRFNENWAINYNLGYSFQRNVLLTNRGAIEYTSRCRCWAVQALIEEDRTRGLRGGVNFTFLGFGMDLSNPFKDGGMLGTGTF